MAQVGGGVAMQATPRGRLTLGGGQPVELYQLTPRPFRHCRLAISRTSMIWHLQMILLLSSNFFKR